MTSIILVDALKDLLDKSLEEYTYTDSEVNTRKVTVYKYYLKQRERGDEEYTPYVVIRPIEGNDTLEESTVKCAIVIAVRDTDPEQGYVNTVNLIEHIRQCLLKTLYIGGRFPIKRPLTWAIDNEPNAPIYMGSIIVECNVANFENISEIPFLSE